MKKFLALSSWSTAIGAVFFAAFALVGCDDSSSVSVRQNDELVHEILTDIRDGQTYKTVTIGTQVWMAENLNYEMLGSFCYDDSAENCAKYGRLYTWTAAAEACPDSWHLPNNAEWETLFSAVGGKSTAGKVLKSQSGWYSDGNGTDAFGFSALSAGGRIDHDEGAYFSNEGRYAYFWSATVDERNPYYMRLHHSNEDALLSTRDNDAAFSVRCVKDK